MKKILACLILTLPLLAKADANTLSFDRVMPENFELVFPNDNNIHPEQSDFKVNNFALMSNEAGERFAIITVTNLSKGGRVLNSKHLLALVANGDRIQPRALSQSFKARETLTLTVNFGASKFPLLSVYSRIENFF